MANKLSDATLSTGLSDQELIAEGFVIDDGEDPTAMVNTGSSDAELIAEGFVIDDGVEPELSYNELLEQEADELPPGVDRAFNALKNAVIDNGVSLDRSRISMAMAFNQIKGDQVKELIAKLEADPVCFAAMKFTKH